MIPTTISDIIKPGGLVVYQWHSLTDRLFSGKWVGINPSSPDIAYIESTDDRIRTKNDLSKISLSEGLVVEVLPEVLERKSLPAGYFKRLVNELHSTYGLNGQATKVKDLLAGQVSLLRKHYIAPEKIREFDSKNNEVRSQKESQIMQDDRVDNLHVHKYFHS